MEVSTAIPQHIPIHTAPRLQKELDLNRTATARERRWRGVENPLLNHATKRPMWKYQQSLPKIPVPPITQTLQQYFLPTLRPLVSVPQMSKMETYCQQLCIPGSEGDSWQTALEQYSAQDNVRSWQDWFRDYSFLLQRASLMAHFNYTTLVPAPASSCDQVTRAARIARALLVIKHDVETEQLQPGKQGKIPHCMAQFPQLFSQTRTPGNSRDSIETYDCANHFVVAHKGVLVYIEGYTPARKPLKTCQLQNRLLHAISAIHNHLNDPPSWNHDPTTAGLGALTALNRSTWAKMRQQILKVEVPPEFKFDNVSSLRKVESSCFVLCLDDTEPDDATPAALKTLMYASASNRWYDKALQAIVCRNGVAGLSVERTAADMDTAASLAQLIATACEADSTPPVDQKDFEMAAQGQYQLPMESFTPAEPMSKSLQASLRPFNSSLIFAEEAQAADGTDSFADGAVENGEMSLEPNSLATGRLSSAGSEKSSALAHLESEPNTADNSGKKGGKPPPKGSSPHGSRPSSAKKPPVPAGKKGAQQQAAGKGQPKTDQKENPTPPSEGLLSPQELNAGYEPPPPSLIHFHLNVEGDVIRQKISHAIERATKECNQSAISYANLTDLSQKVLRKTGITVDELDALVNVSIQQAYYKCFSTYPVAGHFVSQKTFAHGRADLLCRTSNIEALEFIQLYEHGGKNGPLPPIELHRLLWNAASTYMDLTGNMACGNYSDTHVMALRMLAHGVAPLDVKRQLPPKTSKGQRPQAATPQPSSGGAFNTALGPSFTSGSDLRATLCKTPTLGGVSPPGTPNINLSGFSPNSTLMSSPGSPGGFHSTMNSTMTTSVGAINAATCTVPLYKQLTRSSTGSAIVSNGVLPPPLEHLAAVIGRPYTTPPSLRHHQLGSSPTLGSMRDLTPAVVTQPNKRPMSVAHYIHSATEPLRASATSLFQDPLFVHYNTVSLVTGTVASQPNANNNNTLQLSCSPTKDGTVTPTPTPATSPSMIWACGPPPGAHKSIHATYSAGRDGIHVWVVARSTRRAEQFEQACRETIHNTLALVLEVHQLRTHHAE